MARPNYVRQFIAGLFDNNPTFVQLLGMCPTLAVSTSLDNAVGMGLAVTAVLTASNAVISVLRRFIPQRVRIAAYVVIIASFVTMIDLLMQAYFPALSRSLGLYIPLIVVNCIILARAEAFASRNPVLPSIVDGLSMGVGFTLALSCIAVVREVLGSGSLWGLSLFGEHFQPAVIMIMAPGGFLTLGMLIALVQKLREKGERKEGRRS